MNKSNPAGNRNGVITCRYSGMEFNAKDRGADTLFHIELDVLKTMRIQITDVGNENLYFNFIDDRAVTRHGFCKCL